MEHGERNAITKGNDQVGNVKHEGEMMVTKARRLMEDDDKRRRRNVNEGNSGRAML